MLLEQTAIDFSYSKQQRFVPCPCDNFNESQAHGSSPPPRIGQERLEGLISAIKYINRAMIPLTSTQSPLVRISHMTPVLAGVATAKYHKLSGLSN